MSVSHATGGALDVLREGRAEEQECLFYVAQSRARPLVPVLPDAKVQWHQLAGIPVSRPDGVRARE